MTFLSAMESLATYAMILPLIPLCFYPMSGLIKSSIPVLILKIIAVLAAVSVCSLPVLIGIGNAADLPLFIAIAFLMFFFYNKEVNANFFKKLFIFFTGCIAGAYSLLLATAVDTILRPTADFNDFSIRALLIQIGILLAFDAIFYYPLRYKIGWLVAQPTNSRIWRVIWIFPATVTVMCHAMIPHHYYNMHIGRALQIFMIFIILLTIFTLLIYYLFYTITYSIEEKQEIEHRNHLLAMQSQQYHQLLDKVNESSRLRHDFRHQLVIILELLDKKDYEELEKYVHSYAKAASPEITRYVSSLPLNALLSHYEAELQKRGTDVRFDFRLPENYSIADIDLCVIFGNLLENSMYACDNLSHAFVRVKAAQTSSNTLAISVTNPYDQVPVTRDGKFLSSRHEGFGQGLESVRLTVEKYGGTVDIDTSDGQFTVKVLLYI